MAKKVASFRLEVELLDWVASYAKSRGTSQAVVLEAALRGLQEDSASGVPDLPVVDSPSVRRDRAARATADQVVPARSLLQGGAAMARQARLNAAKVRAQGGGKS